MAEDTASFPVTDWSLVRRVAGDEAPGVRRLDLNELLKRYMPPMRRFLRQRFHVDEHQADDWLQGFVTSKVLQSKLLSRADRDRGKFRGLLSHALTGYAIDQMRRARVHAVVYLDAVTQTANGQVSAPAHSDPAVMFDRHWAEHAIAEALEQTKARLYGTRRGPAWEVFYRRMLDGGGESQRSYRLLADEFAFETPAQASTALNTAKRIFRRKLRDILTEYGAEDSDLAAAVRDLKKIFQR